MDRKAMVAEITEVLRKYDIAVAVFGVSMIEGGKLVAYGNTFVPVPSRDREEEVLRDDTSKKVSDLVATLTKNTYQGR